MKWLPLSGCGTQHPLRALGGTRVLLAAAPTTPPCFRRWRRSSSLHSSHIQRKDSFQFCISETTAVVSEMPFHGKGSYRETASLPKGAKKPRRAGRTPSVKACGFATSLSEGGSGETGSFAPEPEALPMLKGSLFEGAVAAGDWGSLPPNAKSPGGRPCSHAPGERVMDFYFLGFLIWNATAM